MINSLVKKYPSSSFVAVGFSLGGNLITKYLGELDVRKPDNIIGGISICQGYIALEYVSSILYVEFCFNKCFYSFRATTWLLKWQNFHRFYLYVLTENVKSIILKHRHILLCDDVKKRCNLNEREIVEAATLPELDEAYTRKVHNFNSVAEMYNWSSSINYLHNIAKPIIFINSKDDPLVPENLLIPIREFASMFIFNLF